MKDLLSSYKLCAVGINQPFLTAESMAVNTRRRGCRDGAGIPDMFPWQPFSQSLRDRPHAGVGTNWQSREALTKDAGGTSRDEDGGTQNGQLWSPHLIRALILFPRRLLRTAWSDREEQTMLRSCCCGVNICIFGHNFQPRPDGSWCYMPFLSPTASREAFERPGQSKLAGSNIKPRAKCSLLLRSPWFQRTDIAGIWNK